MRILLALLVFVPAILAQQTDLRPQQGQQELHQRLQQRQQDLLQLQQPGQQTDLPKPRLVIAGMSGSGKSTLANVLLGADPLCDNCTFNWCSGTDSCTKETTYATGNWMGSGVDFTIVDTPGFGDSDGEDAANVEEMMEILNEVVESANGILLLFKGDIGRFQEGLVNMVREMTMLFGESMWEHVIIGVSFWPYDQESIDGRNENCALSPKLCHDEAWLVNEINRQLQEKIHMTRNLSAVFIDSWSQISTHLDDETQQFYFQQETEKLFNFLDTGDDFLFRTINDVLLENEEMKNEIDWLNNIIEQNITEIQSNITEIEEDIEDVRIDTAHNTELISQDEIKIQANANGINDNLNSIDAHDVRIQELASLLSDVNTKLDASNEELNTKLDAAKKELNTKLDAANAEINSLKAELSGLNQVPVGTIIAWTNHLENGDTIGLPDGWIECDGQTIAEGIWKNKATPKINSEGRFLRGAPLSSVLETQEDMVHDLSFHDRYVGIYGCDSGDTNQDSKSWEVDVNGNHGDDKKCYKTRKLSEIAGNAVGDETRPKSMKVTYIIKIK